MTETNQNRTYRPGLEVVPGYTLVKPLGSGMAGDVWVARAAGGTQVAVKIVRSLSKLGGRKEFQALKTLRNIRHPNLCPVHGFWTKDANGQLLKDGETQSNLPDSSVITFNRDGKPIKSPESPLKETMAVDSITSPPEKPKREESIPKAEQLIVVMGLGDCTLNDRLIEFREAAGISEKLNTEVCGLDAQEVIEYLRAASKAIDELNQQHKIYHCDIKPQNILMVGGGIQVCDFGLANRFDGDLRKTQQAFASPAYAAPEVLLGSTYSRTVDQYSLAITYYELRTGVLPFETTTQASVIVAKQNETLDLRHVSPAERKVLRKATKVEPLERYDTCTEFINALALASGVDKPSGITRKRAGIAAAVVLAMFGGLIYWEANRSTAADEIVDAEDAWAQVSDKEIEVGYESRFVVMSLGHMLDANDKSPTAKQAKKIRDFVTQRTLDLVDIVQRGLDDGDVNDDERENIPDHLLLLDQIRESSILDPKDSLRADLVVSVALARTQMQMLSKAKDAAPKWSDDDLEILRGSQKIGPAVTVALTHFNEQPGEGYYLTEPGFTDIERAQNQINSQGLAELPVWALKRWKEMKSQFVAQFSTFRENSKASANKGKRIDKTWRDIASAALFGRLFEYSSLGQWDEFQGEVPSLSKSVTDASRNRSLQVFREMDNALRSPVTAKKHIEQVQTLMVPPDEGEDFLIEEFRLPLSEWMREISGALLSKSLAPKDARAIYMSGSSLILMTKGKIPAELDRLAMSSTLKVGAYEISPDLQGVPFDIIEIAKKWQRREGVNGILASAILLEQVPEATNQNDRNSIQTMQQRPTVQKEFIKLSSPQIADFLVLLAHAASGSVDQELLDKFSPPNETAIRIRDSLNPDRQRQIAGLFLDLANDKSLVPDEDVAKLRFTDSDAGKVLVEHAEWWMQHQSDSQTTTNRRLKIQQFLLKISHCRRQRIPLDQAIDFDELSKLVSSELTQPEDGQLYRATFEVLSSAIGSDSTKSPISTVSLLIRATVAMCDLVQPDLIRNPQWRVTIMDPAMAVVRSQPQRTIDPKLELRFVDYYLMTMELMDDNDEVHLTNLEFASASAASNPSVAKDRRFEMWIQASDLLQQKIQQIADASLLPSLIKLNEYVLSAEAVKPGDPEVAVHRAFGKYYHARVLKDQEKLVDAERSLNGAIAALEGSAKRNARQLISLYNAYWRHANMLVILANAHKDQPDEMRPLLEKARISAKNATILFQENDLEDLVDENRSQMVLGNACEDLAHYCYKTNVAQQEIFFNEAIQAHQRAVNATKFGENSLKPKYSLARCRFRFGKAQHDRQQLVLANQDLGSFSDKASSTSQVKWLVWKGLVQQALGNRNEAINRLSRAYQLVLERGQEISASDQAETSGSYAVLLARNGTDQQKRKSIQIINTIELPSWSLIELQCISLFEVGRYDDLIQFIGSIPGSRLSDFGGYPAPISEHLAVISNAIRIVADEKSQQRRTDADKCLNKLLAQTIRKYESESESTPKARAYSEIVKAHARSLDDGEPRSVRIRQYLTAFRFSEGANLSKPIVVDLQKALFDQFYYGLKENVNDIADLGTDDKVEAKTQLQLLLDTADPNFSRQQRKFLRSLLTLSALWD